MRSHLGFGLRGASYFVFSHAAISRGCEADPGGCMRAIPSSSSSAASVGEALDGILNVCVCCWGGMRSIPLKPFTSVQAATAAGSSELGAL